MPGTLQPAQR